MTFIGKKHEQPHHDDNIILYIVTEMYFTKKSVLKSLI